jgi:hypothetical protein
MDSLSDSLKLVSPSHSPKSPMTKKQKTDEDKSENSFDSKIDPNTHESKNSSKEISETNSEKNIDEKIDFNTLAPSNEEFSEDETDDDLSDKNNEDIVFPHQGFSFIIFLI